ncbi:hypothetical protein BKA61DRAFT_683493 [Leptodontidium sp. MPI-SDFR-AT-0119]|nr:hypothetical protein BKA61DRAFT_683493 [Leptodontidium sp. MPI-SDFR-AT-0119]
MENRTALEGQLKAKFWVSCNDTDYMDISLSPCKVDKAGKIFEHIYVPWHALPTDNIDAQENVPNYNTIKHIGPSGVLGVSHREQVSNQTTEAIP